MKKVWLECRESLQKNLGKISFDTWIAPLNLKSWLENTIVLETPDAFFKKWLETNYLTYIQAALHEVSHKDIQIRLEVNPQLLKRKDNKIFRSIGKTFQEEPQDSLRLLSRFTFDNFVVGTSNRMAHAASLAVANVPGKSYNPLFIYGGVGLGKTHLMQAIAHKIMLNNPKAKVKYTSSENFTNELIVSIQNRSTQRFRQKYRNIDVLLIDDVHFLSGKEAIQEAFFHTFNVLYDYHKQIVVSSDRPPREIPKLEERLVSRFSWGLVVDIQPPDFETRVAILNKKLKNEPIDIEKEVVNFIAKNIDTNIRELEGALVRIIAYSLIENKKINIDLAKNILKDMVKEIGRKVTPQSIIEKTAKYFNVSVGDLKKTRRSKSLILPRHIIMYLIRKFTDLSLPEIGGIMGAKHHTTVLYAIKKLKNKLNQDNQLKNTIDTITQEIERHK